MSQPFRHPKGITIVTISFYRWTLVKNCSFQIAKSDIGASQNGVNLCQQIFSIIRWQILFGRIIGAQHDVSDTDNTDGLATLSFPDKNQNNSSEYLNFS